MAKSEQTVEERAKVAAGWFGARLREVRSARGISQKRLGEMIGVPQSRIAEWEAPSDSPGKPPLGPAWEYVVRCALALDVSTDAFLRAPASDQPPTLPAGRKADGKT